MFLLHCATSTTLTSAATTNSKMADMQRKLALSKMADVQRKLALSDGIARLLDSADLADFTIVCGSTEWNVHRLVLSLQSSVLARARDNGLLVSISVHAHKQVLQSIANSQFAQESETHKIDLSEHDVLHIRAMIDYLYQFDYEVKGGTNHQDKLCFHIDMCTLADKYDISGLANLSIEKFSVTEPSTQG